MHERQGWLSTTLRVELCQGSAFLPQRLHPASAVQEERALQRAMFAAVWHGCRRDQVDVSGEARIRLHLSLCSAGTRPWETTWISTAGWQLRVATMGLPHRAVLWSMGGRHALREKLSCCPGNCSGLIKSMTCCNASLPWPRQQL